MHAALVINISLVPAWRCSQKRWIRPALACLPVQLPTTALPTRSPALLRKEGNQRCYSLRMLSSGVPGWLEAAMRRVLCFLAFCWGGSRCVWSADRPAQLPSATSSGPLMRSRRGQDALAVRHSRVEKIDRLDRWSAEVSTTDPSIPSYSPQKSSTGQPGSMPTCGRPPLVSAVARKGTRDEQRRSAESRQRMEC